MPFAQKWVGLSFCFSCGCCHPSPFWGILSFALLAPVVFFCSVVLYVQASAPGQPKLAREKGEMVCLWLLFCADFGWDANWLCSLWILGRTLIPEVEDAASGNSTTKMFLKYHL